MPATIEEKLNAGREYRTVTNNLKELVVDTSGTDPSMAEGEIFTVRGYATVFDTPYELCRGDGYIVREQIASGAFANCDMSDVIMQFDHTGQVYARGSNNTLTITPDEKGLFINAYLGGTEDGQKLFRSIKGGYVTKMSFGFTVDTDSWETQRDDNGVVTDTRTIKAIRKVYDVSAVSIPANDATEISARSLFDGVVNRHEAERLEERKRAELKKKLELRLRLMGVEK